LSWFIIALAVALALYMAWTIGANDVANAMGASVGSKALSLKQAIILAGLFEFVGAVLIGAWVSDTVQKNIVVPEAFADPNVLIIGLTASLLAAAIWVTIATYWALPVSTSHAIVGALIGFGGIAVVQGTIPMSAVGFSKVGEIALSWGASPFAAAGIAWLMFVFLRRRVLHAEDPIQRARSTVPIMTGLVLFLLSLSVFYDSLGKVGIDLELWQSISMALIVAAMTWAVAYAYIRKKEIKVDTDDDLAGVEKLFGVILVVASCYVAFAHGANNVANAVGPVLAIVNAAGGVNNIYFALLVVGGLGLVLGISTYGYKVMETIGQKITDITPTRGFAATFATATVTLVCTRLGYPTSVSQVMVGAIVGVGLAGGIRALDFKVIRNIIISWVITVPIAAGLAVLLYLGLLQIVGGLT